VIILLLFLILLTLLFPPLMRIIATLLFFAFMYMLASMAVDAQAADSTDYYSECAAHIRIVSFENRVATVCHDPQRVAKMIPDGFTTSSCPNAMSGEQFNTFVHEGAQFFDDMVAASGVSQACATLTWKQQ